MFTDVRYCDEHRSILCILDVGSDSDFENFAVIFFFKKAAKRIVGEVAGLDEFDDPF